MLSHYPKYACTIYNVSWNKLHGGHVEPAGMDVGFGVLNFQWRIMF